MQRGTMIAQPPSELVRQKLPPGTHLSKASIATLGSLASAMVAVYAAETSEDLLVLSAGDGNVMMSVPEVVQSSAGRVRRASDEVSALKVT